MIQTSAAYKEAIKAETELVTFAGRFGFVPPGSVEGSRIAISRLSEVRRIDQLKNGKEGMSERWATGELNRFLLDGNTVAIKKDEERQVGCFYEAIGNEEGGFLSDPTLTYIMDAAYDMMGITVVFDDKGEEYADTITLQYYDNANTLLKEETYQNTEATAKLDLLQQGVKKFKVIFNHWSMPRRMAKISQVLPGQFFDFTPQNTFQFELKEEIKPFDSGLVMPEFTILFDNSDHRFDIVNPAGLVAYLRQKMQVKAKLNVQTANGEETVNAGEFYVYSWPTSGEDEESSLTCRPALGFENKYYKNAGRGLQTVEDAAAILFEGIKEPYIIDEELKGIQVNQYIGDDVTKIDAVGQLAIACAGCWRFCRDGSYHLRRWDAEIEPTNVIDYDNAWTKPSITQERKVTSVNVKYYKYQSGEGGEEIQSYDYTARLNPDDGEQKSISSGFVASEEQAKKIAEAALSYYDMRLKYASSWRGDATMEPGDIVTIQNDYGNSDVMITSSQITWDEKGLAGEVTGRAK